MNNKTSLIESIRIDKFNKIVIENANTSVIEHKTRFI